VAERKGDGLFELAKATAGWNEERGVTVVQRRKEEASDYRYFPEPDLTPVRVATELRERIRADLGELPAALRVRLREQYGLSEYDASVITRSGRVFTRYFEEVARLCGDAKEASNWITNEVQQKLNENKQTIGEFPLSAEALADLIQHIKKSGLNKQRAREMFAHLLAHGGSAAEAAEKLGFKTIGDESQLLEIIRRAIAANPKAVADFKKGKTKAADAIKGAVMRETKGMANTELVQRLLLEELATA
jgi:aspartyl-tRNA(Asn)/glutamyl-tRNA(Gln) amidotransferase subunit B